MGEFEWELQKQVPSDREMYLAVIDEDDGSSLALMMASILSLLLLTAGSC